MRKKPVVVGVSKEAPEGVGRKVDKVQYESLRGRRHLYREVETVTITNKTPTESLQNLPEKIGASLEDHFQAMEDLAIYVLEAADMPTETVKYETAEKVIQTSPQVVVEEEIGKYTDEYQAAMVLWHVRQAKKSINDNATHSAAHHSLKAGIEYQKLLTNDYAYAVGLEATKPKKADQWILIADDILKKEGITIKTLMDKGREWTVAKLAVKVALKTDGDNEKSIANSLRDYYRP